MGNKISYAWLFLPLGVLVFLTVAVFIERSGVTYEVQRPSLYFLEPMDPTLATPEYNSQAECLVLYNSAGVVVPTYRQTIYDALDSMRVEYDSLDVENMDKLDYQGYQTIVVAFEELDRILPQINELSEWVKNGGRMLFSIRPDFSIAFMAIYRKLGIHSIGENYADVRGVRFISDFLPGVKGKSLGLDLMYHTSLPVRLEEDSNVHLVSADEYQLPLLWEHEYGQGRFVVINTDQFGMKSSRGIIGAAYSLLQDVFVYPVINSSLFFIDDFPSPVPEGEHELITKEFGRDIRSFYTNVWWPDMQNFAHRYGIEYSGMVIETYNYEVAEPFERQPAVDMFQYFGGLLIEGDGEIGLHGYNHVPFCLEDDDINRHFGYPAWSSTEAMQASVEELHNYVHSLFPDQPLVTYVPPSNVLCPEARQWLPIVLPELKVISSVYIQDDNLLGYPQEFTEAPDNIIELPRIVAGFEPSEYMIWTAINEIALHFVYSHFVHPDDVMDEERGRREGWTHHRETFDEYLLWLHTAAPKIRNMTASEGAMALQRFDRLDLSGVLDNASYTISLENFYDEAWLLMRTSFDPETIEGGSFTELTEGLYLIEARQPEVAIRFEE